MSLWVLAAQKQTQLQYWEVIKHILMPMEPTNNNQIVSTNPTAAPKGVSERAIAVDNAIKKAKADPSTPWAKEVSNRVMQGAYDAELKELGKTDFLKSVYTYRAQTTTPDIYGQSQGEARREEQAQAETNFQELKAKSKEAPAEPGQFSNLTLEEARQMQQERTKAGRGIPGFVRTAAQKFGQGISQMFSGAEEKVIEDSSNRSIDIQGRITEELKNANGDPDKVRRLQYAQALAEQTARGTSAQDVVSEFIRQGATEKEVLEGAADLITIVTTAGSLPSAGSKVAAAGAGSQGVLKGAVQAGKELAKEGAIFGAATIGTQGAAAKVSEDAQGLDAGAEFLKALPAQALKGAAIGGGTGFAAGFGTGLTRGIIDSKITSGANLETALKKQGMTGFSKADQELFESIRPDDTGYIQNAAREGRLVYKGKGKNAQAFVVPSKNEQYFKVAKEIGIDANDTVTNNISKVNNAVKDSAEVLSANLKNSGATINKNQLRTEMEAIRDSKTIIFKSDKSLKNAYNSVIDDFLVDLEQAATQYGDDIPADVVSDARVAFNQKMRSLIPNLESKVADPATNIQANAIKDLRGVITDSIEKAAPDSNIRTILQKQRGLYELQDNLTGRISKNVTDVAIERLQSEMRRNPALRTVLAALTTGAGVLGAGKLIADAAGLNE